MDIQVTVTEENELFTNDIELSAAANEICEALLPYLTFLLEQEAEDKKKAEKSPKVKNKNKKIDLENYCLQSKIPGGNKREYNEAFMGDLLNSFQGASISGSRSSSGHGMFSGHSRNPSPEEKEKLKQMIMNPLGKHKNESIFKIRDNIRHMPKDKMMATINDVIAKRRCFQ